MNKKLWPIFFLSILFLVSCTSKDFNEKLESGKKALENQKFEVALADLSKANELEPEDKETKALLEITRNIIDCKTAMESGESEAALFLINKVLENNNHYLNKRLSNYAKKLKGDLELTIKQTANLKDIIEKGHQLLDQKRYNEALNVLQNVNITDSTNESITKLQNEIKVLQVEAEKAKELAVAQQKLEEEKKAAEAARIEAEQNRLKAYGGNWGDANFYSNGGNGLTITFINSNTATVAIQSVSSPPANRIAEISFTARFPQNGTTSFTFDDDGWFSKGSGTIKLANNQVIVTITITEKSEDNWSIFSGTKTFSRDKSN
ncbi:hypothetical protein [Neobacillus cucumis]|uniref:hypothetical protein n=1 Tax=Neobacillus cucumis TaxID=1740721 RepID=UPI0019647C59|nr:hypothetical protein [Neobacillus cucumis]MBM7656354.1 NADH dehydrogenase/NADH:ubiquinone oxidoreductase subunit G [Neobacillus cucumis]